MFLSELIPAGVGLSGREPDSTPRGSFPPLESSVHGELCLYFLPAPGLCLEFLSCCLRSSYLLASFSYLTFFLIQQILCSQRLECEDSCRFKGWNLLGIKSLCDLSLSSLSKTLYKSGYVPERDFSSLFLTKANPCWTWTERGLGDLVFLETVTWLWMECPRVKGTRHIILV